MPAVANPISYHPEPVLIVLREFNAGGGHAGFLPEAAPGIVVRLRPHSSCASSICFFSVPGTCRKALASPLRASVRAAGQLLGGASWLPPLTNVSAHGRGDIASGGRGCVLPQAAPRLAGLHCLAAQQGAVPHGGPAPCCVPAAESGAPKVRLVVKYLQPAYDMHLQNLRLPSIRFAFRMQGCRADLRGWTSASVGRPAPKLPSLQLAFHWQG